MGANIAKSSLETSIAMFLYMLIIIGIGVYFAKRAHKDTESYYLGGRSLGPLVSAMSAEASDMSGWLLMGLPGVAYWFGLADAAWTAIGLGIGTYVNWLLVAPRLRVYSELANNSITVPDYISNRFKEKKPIIMSVAALFILIFFTVYAASCFVTMGKLFSVVFNAPYLTMMIVGAIFVLIYTLLGGFLAESVSDTLQAFVMILALSVILILGISHAGGLGNIFGNLGQFPGFMEWFGIANPTMENGVQAVNNGVPVFGEAGAYGLLVVISTMSWGLGYFGMPQVLLRFMGIRTVHEIKSARRIAMVWVVISLGAAVLIGLMGRNLFPTELTTYAESESIFVLTAQKFLPPFLAGIVLAGILAATISSSDSYLLIAASAVSKNLYQGVFRKNATEKQVLNFSHLTLIVIMILAMFMAMDENSSIFRIVSFAWAGFGATFGPIILYSVFSKKVTREAAIAGMLAGGIMVFVWKLLIRPMGGIFGLYELGPSFLFSLIVIWLVSTMTKPSSEVVAQHKQFEEQYAATEK